MLVTKRKCKELEGKLEETKKLSRELAELSMQMFYEAFGQEIKKYDGTLDLVSKVLDFRGDHQELLQVISKCSDGGHASTCVYDVNTHLSIKSKLGPIDLGILNNDQSSVKAYREAVIEEERKKKARRKSKNA